MVSGQSQLPRVSLTSATCSFYKYLYFFKSKIKTYSAQLIKLHLCQSEALLSLASQMALIDLSKNNLLKIFLPVTLSA